MASSKSVDLTQGPVSQHVMRMLVPFWVAILAMMSAGIVDTIYLGHLSTNALAAVGFCFPIVFVGNSVNIGLSAGTMSAISRAIGRKDRVMSQNLGASAFLLSLCVISLLYVVGGAFAPNVLTLMGATPEIKPLSLGYLKYALPGLIVMGMAMMANNILRASGEAMLPSAIMISTAVFNIIIDPLLIFGLGPFPRMEVEGAALATLIANILGMAFGFFVVFYMRKAASFTSLNVQRLISYWRAILHVGFPAIWTNVIVPFSGLAATAIVARTLGTTEVAAFTVVSRIGMLALTLLYALSACIGAITGQNGGAGLTERVRATFVFCFKICVAWGLLVGAVLGIFAHTIPWVFTQDAEVVRLALPYFYIVPFTFAFYGFVFVSAAGFNALGRPRYGLIFTIIRSVILFVPFIWIGVTLFGMTGVFLGIASANIVSGLVAIAYTLKRAPMTVHEK